MIINLLIASLVLFVMWVVFANVKRYTGPDYPAWIQMPALLYSVIFGAVDVIYNYTFGVLVFDICFGDWPTLKHPTLSERLRHILKEEHQYYTKRWRLAYWVCRKAISPWDWNHCGMGLG